MTCLSGQGGLRRPGIAVLLRKLKLHLAAWLGLSGSHTRQAGAPVDRDGERHKAELLAVANAVQQKLGQKVVDVAATTDAMSRQAQTMYEAVRRTESMTADVRAASQQSVANTRVIAGAAQRLAPPHQPAPTAHQERLPGLLIGHAGCQPANDDFCKLLPEASI